METTKVKLTPTEMGKLWATYMGNTLGECTLSFFLKHVDDPEIKKILEFALDLSQTFIEEMKGYFQEADFPMPVGFSIEEDVDLTAPRLFYDEFYLHYLKYLGKAGMSLYSIAIPLVSRKDIRDFFKRCFDGAAQLISYTNDLLATKGKLMNAPKMPSPSKVDFVEKQFFLNDYFGTKRPLHGLEVAHLYANLNSDITSKALIMGFNQGTKSEEVRKYLIRGKNLNQRHINWFSAKLNESDVPAPSLLDHLVTPSTTPTFSDKLMVFHKVDMFSMRVRECGNGMSVNGRKDIGALFAKSLAAIALYAEDGANMMIKNGWMEQPPEVIDRENLTAQVQYEGV